MHDGQPSGSIHTRKCSITNQCDMLQPCSSYASVFYVACALQTLFSTSCAADNEQQLIELQFDHKQQVNVMEAVKMELMQVRQGMQHACH